MRIAVIIVRVLMGAMFLMASVTFFLELVPQPQLAGDIKTYTDGLNTVHLMSVVKTVELVCGIAFVVGRFVALAAVMIFPIIINIVLLHAFLMPDQILIPILLLAGNGFLFFAYRKNYAGLFEPRRIE